MVEGQEGGGGGRCNSRRKLNDAFACYRLARRTREPVTNLQRAVVQSYGVRTGATGRASPGFSAIR